MASRLGEDRFGTSVRCATRTGSRTPLTARGKGIRMSTTVSGVVGPDGTIVSGVGFTADRVETG